MCPTIETLRGAALKRLLFITGAIVFGTVGAQAGELIETNTNARICRNEPCRVETFSGGYYVKGGTHPSKTGQKVKFEYKRRGSENWHRFGRTEESTRTFVSTDGTAFDRLNDGSRFREHFDIQGGFPHRRWVIRARFQRQDGYKASADRVPVRIAFGD